MKILLIEDDVVILKTLTKALKEKGFLVDSTLSSEEGEKLWNKHKGKYHLVIIDVHLPKLSGVELGTKFRISNNVIPILFVSSDGSWKSKQNCFENVLCDDYLVKPFAMSELIARVNVLIRRAKILKTTPFQVGDVLINASQHSTKVGNKTIQLYPLDFRLLHLLATHKGKLLSFEFIISNIWKNRHKPSSNTLQTHIRTLRKVFRK